MLSRGFTVGQMVDLRIRTPTHGYEPTREAVKRRRREFKSWDKLS